MRQVTSTIGAIVRLQVVPAVLFLVFAAGSAAVLLWLVRSTDVNPRSVSAGSMTTLRVSAGEALDVWLPEDVPAAKLNLGAVVRGDPVDNWHSEPVLGRVTRRGFGPLPQVLVATVRLSAPGAITIDLSNQTFPLTIVDHFDPVILAVWLPVAVLLAIAAMGSAGFGLLRTIRFLSTYATASGVNAPAVATSRPSAGSP